MIGHDTPEECWFEEAILPSKAAKASGKRKSHGELLNSPWLIGA
jgi:hypothetical protein